ncbi:MAG: MauE/DoxX family redox-associated membrane protein [Thermoanaerobaculia bacterium]
MTALASPAAGRSRESPAADPRAARAGSPWPGRIGFLGGSLLGLVLLIAAYAKAIDPEAFAQQIRGEGLALFGAPFAWAVAMVAVEVGLGVALLMNLRRRSVLVPATLLVALFVFLTARTYWRVTHGGLSAADAASCGCFGNLVERTPAEAFWQDVLMLVPTLALAWIGRPAAVRPPDRRRRAVQTAVAGLAALAAGVFAALAPGLSLDDLATRLRPGATLSGICAGTGDKRICLDTLVPGLARGSRWVVLADIRSAGFAELAGQLNRYVQSAAAGSRPTVAVLADFTQEEQMELFWRLAPAFDLHEVPAAVLRPLYRRLPRTFFVEEGRVTRTIPGLPEEIVSPADPNNRKTDDPQP